MNNKNKEYILGAIFGAICGDVCGATLEFTGFDDKNIALDKANNALKLLGGGIHSVGEGQATDDTEMLICLFKSLFDETNETNDSLNFDSILSTIAKNYIDWYNSEPFDIGLTILGPLQYVIDNYNINNSKQNLETNVEINTENITKYQNMINYAKKYNYTSKSNGSLMRAVPWGIFYSIYGDSIISLIKTEVSLTHSNELCQEVSVIYAMAIGYLINNNQDISGVFKIVEEYINTLENSDNKYELQDYLRIIKTNNLPSEFNTRKNGGYVKYGFVLAFWHLYNNHSYIESITDVLARGGDTDTNACIVGGLLGACYGFSTIPNNIVEKVLNYDYEINNGHKRPEWLHPKTLLNYF